MRTWLACVIGCAALLAGCPSVTVVPDPRIPKKVAKSTVVEVWMLVGEKDYRRQEILLPEGWWIVSPIIAEAE